MQVSEFRDEVRASLIGFSWDQWTQLGVSGNRAKTDQWAVDPEALLVFSLETARHEPRLFDEILDWLTINLRLVSVQRLRNIAGHHQEVERLLVDAALAWAGAHSTELTRRAPRTPGTALEPQVLFRIGGRDARVIRADPIFAAYGFQKPSTELSRKSRPPDLSSPINLAFRLREIFGVGSRAEVARILLTSPAPLLLSEIAQDSAYASRNIRDTLRSMVAAGVVMTSQRGKTRSYGVERSRWCRFLGISETDIPTYVSWVPLLRLLTKIHLWLETDGLAHESEYILASEARHLMDELERDLQAAGAPPSGGRRALGSDYWPEFVEGVRELVRGLEGRGATRSSSQNP